MLMLLISMYMVEGEKRARREREARAEAEQAQLVQKICPAVEPGQPQGDPWGMFSALLRLVSAHGSVR